MVIGVQSFILFCEKTKEKNIPGSSFYSYVPFCWF